MDSACLKEHPLEIWRDSDHSTKVEYYIETNDDNFPELSYSEKKWDINFAWS